MSFSGFSKDFSANMFTSVENQFITKYLPQANGDAVRVYLYGLYLCSRKEDFDGESAAKLLKIPYARLLEIYGFWEECDLVHILSRDPLLVEYLPVNAAVGKPKPIRPEKYAEFNRELLMRLQRAKKDFKPYELQRILEFLENNPMEPQAFLLVVEYCAKKDGDKLSSAHVLNKAKQLCDAGKYTYEQVQESFSGFNRHEREIGKIFTLLGVYRKPQESDFDYLEKWLSWGMETETVLSAAAALKKGSLASLDVLLTEMKEKEIFSKADADDYLARREELASVVFSVARKLGVKVQNPRAYVEEYAEKWLDRGYDPESLLLLAGLSFKLRYGFQEMDALIDSLYAEGVVDGTGVKSYCSARDAQLRLLQSVQSVCGVVKKTQTALDMVAAWKAWNFSDEMILEAAKRSTGAAAPLPYMNKLLSAWKRTGVLTPDAIPEQRAESDRRAEFKNEAAISADRRAEREHYYAVLRQSAEAGAEKARQRAAEDGEFSAADAELKKQEIALARAETFAPETAELVRSRLQRAKADREGALRRLGLKEEDFLPKYRCRKCSDTGFLPDGRICDCYPE